ncbi:MAG: hypothetical protein A2W72_16160 [Burkholderiales bacterium RIFCSPLOWO2_12_67_14]|nr:MAG: hypothetical protein A3I64_01760 [Burkholderiales bacterium RIFCSPLOWO2_02_FULL_67_64]OGB38637.1 MAG: hypothetical protein A2W72_16160 [Burkholderiales bacterium RIFCSPLOWO2_12_67_14]OGB40310.1 MAG: hypothetical protein A3E51_26785 [Burkholderiales bacterium RIFCSPHIGHO2_12_FULL_67_38]OGB78804.1 MAG: hypothetical protein A3G82_09655 [Burkholderiales bacterium RIFCSPLOWO2_12_FULL_67_210]
MVPLSDLYTAKDRTVSQVLASARSALLTTAVGQTVGGFFTVPGGGSCPTYSASIPYIDADVTIDAFCAPWMTSIASVISAALMVVAAFWAFRVAFL